MGAPRRLAVFLAFLAAVFAGSAAAGAALADQRSVAPTTTSVPLGLQVQQQMQMGGHR